MSKDQTVFKLLQDPDFADGWTIGQTDTRAEGRARNFLSDKLVLQGKCSQKPTHPYEKLTCPASQE